MEDRFAVAVVGAGPAGSALALRLARRGYSTLLVERTRFAEPRVGESLSPAVQPLLREIGVWKSFLCLGPVPSFGTRSVWGSHEVDEHSHVMNPYGCGWHVERTSFDRMLAEEAVAAGADFRCGSVIVGCERSADGGWTLGLDGGSEQGTNRLQAAMVVDATGRFAHTSRWMGAKRIILDRLIAAATLFVGVDVSHQGYVLVETTSNGWWYSAPVPPDGLMVMLMTDSDLIGGRDATLAERWATSLAHTSTTSSRVRGAPAWGPRVFSAQSQRLRRSETDAPWIAVGDAGLAVDPVSGSGVVRALRSAATAADTIAETLDNGSSSAIATFETQRDDECTDYLHERLAYYGAEERWTESPFWSRQRSGARRAVTVAPGVLEQRITRARSSLTQRGARPRRPEGRAARPRDAGSDPVASAPELRRATRAPR